MPAPNHHGEIITLIDNVLGDLGSGRDASRPAGPYTRAEHLCPKPMSVRTRAVFAGRRAARTGKSPCPFAASPNDSPDLSLK